MSTAPSPDLPLTPLAETDVPASVQRLVDPKAPGPMRTMGARGLAPLPPQELALALYQLYATEPDGLGKIAAQSVHGLPEPVLKVVLPAPLDPRVLDFLARNLRGRRGAIDLLLRNRNLHDRTAEHLASVGSAEDIDQIALDETRLLRCPAIIAALYLNPRARTSTALRAVEIAARNSVAVDIPGFEDIVASLHGVTLTPQDDQKFQELVPESAAPPTEPLADDEQLVDAKVHVTQEEIEKAQQEEEQGAVLTDEEQENKKQRFEDLPVPLQIRAATLGNAFDRSIAIRSSVRTVAMAAIRSPSLGINEVIKYAANRALHEDIIRYISNKKKWVQLTSVKLALINNNKTPLGTALRFLPYVNVRDLKSLSKSKNIPGPLQKAAKDLLAKREKK